MKKRLALAAVAALITLPAVSALAEPIFFGPHAYLSANDIPAGFYDDAGPVVFDDLEDGSLDSTVIASAGSFSHGGGLTDSVDADDGAIDGTGLSGTSLWASAGTGFVFTFDTDELPTAAGLVVTDIPQGSAVFEAFAADGSSLGTIEGIDIDDGRMTGETYDDYFFGVQDLDGIASISVKGMGSGGGIEVDHIQYGVAATSTEPVPEPGTMALAGLGLFGLAALKKRKREE